LKLAKIALPVIILLVAAYAFSVSGTDKRSQELTRVLEETASQKNKPILYTGKLVDFDGNPVPNAQVTLDINYVDPKTGYTNKVQERTTGENGTFSLEGQGFRVYLKNIEAEGYEFNNSYNDRVSFNVGSGEFFNDAVNDDADFILRVRKREEPALILKGGYSLEACVGTNYYLDLFSGFHYRDNELIVAKERKHVIDVKITNERMGDACFLEFSPMEGSEVVYVGDKLNHRYEDISSPTNNRFELSEINEKYLYVKGVSGNYHAAIRMLAESRYGKRYIRLMYVYNPEGGTSLEYTPSVTNKYFEDIKNKKRKPVQRIRLSEGG